MHWVYEREARANLGKALRAAGATIYGWSEDQSDPMTDYHHPEDWDGIAVYQGYIIVVDCSPYHADDMNDMGDYPKVQANPKGYTWHIEREGKILVRGTGLSRCCRHGHRNVSNDIRFEEYKALPIKSSAQLAGKMLNLIDKLSGRDMSPCLGGKKSPITGMEPALSRKHPAVS